MERAKGIEPSYAAWEAAVLPLNYARKRLIPSTFLASAPPKLPGDYPAGLGRAIARAAPGKFSRCAHFSAVFRLQTGSLSLSQFALALRPSKAHVRRGPDSLQAVRATWESRRSPSAPSGLFALPQSAVRSEVVRQWFASQGRDYSAQRHRQAVLAASVAVGASCGLNTSLTTERRSLVANSFTS